MSPPERRDVSSKCLRPDGWRQPLLGTDGFLEGSRVRTKLAGPRILLSSTVSTPGFSRHNVEGLRPGQTAGAPRALARTVVRLGAAAICACLRGAALGLAQATALTIHPATPTPLQAIGPSTACEPLPAMPEAHPKVATQPSTGRTAAGMTATRQKTARRIPLVVLAARGRTLAV